ncbi:MAG: hypothetical protein ACTILK_00310 [Bifidobacterium crudilactis]|uniref:hypothetical protein n=1 Tax=Bifidobacterium crudilactis TaxID=327277 RepID=UPI003F958F57
MRARGIIMALVAVLLGAIFVAPTASAAPAGPIKQELELTINLPSTQAFIVPTMVASSYNWNISVDGGNATTYTGTGSTSNTSVGPNLGTLSAGEHTILIKPVTEIKGWLAAFATYGDSSKHVSAERITAVGDIPYKGLSSSRPAYEMFHYATKLTSIGSVLDTKRDADWAAVTTASTITFFFYETFYGTPLTSLLVDSFNTSNITTVSRHFFYSTFYNTKLTSLPDGSFDTSGITATGGEFFNYTFKNVPLTTLPSGSFDTSNMKSFALNHYFFDGTFYNTSLTSLPKGSFDTSGITATGGSFFRQAFYSTPLTSLPSGSFDTSNITTVGAGFFSQAFNDTNLQGDSIVQVTSKLPNLSQEDLDKSTVLSNTFRNTPAAGRLTTDDMPLLTKAPATANNMFTGTGLCTLEPTYAKWGLSDTCPTSFDITIPTGFALLTNGDTTQQTDNLAISEAELPPGKRLTVRLKNTGASLTLNNNGRTAAYEIGDGTTAHTTQDGALLLSVNADAPMPAPASINARLRDGQPPDDLCAGTYTGTVTFAVALEDIS